MTAQIRQIYPARILAQWLPIVTILVMMAMAWRYGGVGFVLVGLQEGGEFLFRMTPGLALAFFLGRLMDQIMQRFLSPETTLRRLGTESGWRALGWVTLAGALFPGGPYAYYPFVGTLMRAGTNPRLLVAFIAAKNLWSVTRLPLEFALLGPRLTLARIAVTFFIPPLLGIAAGSILTPRDPLPIQKGIRSHDPGMPAREIFLLLLVIFLFIGYGNVFITLGVEQAWLTPSKLWQGILLAEVAGLLLPGGPYAVFPLAALVYEAGVGIGPAVTLVTSSVMLALPTVIFEIPFLGPGFTAKRIGLGLAFPVLAGVLAHILQISLHFFG
jgi:uncharacterized membrane protein YraQ (UPF0718 family)